MKRIIISTLILAVLSGCSIYRKYPRTAEADRNLYGKEYSSEDSTSIATLSWKELFTDTCLQRLIDTALVHNTDLGTARLHVEQAEAALLTARLSYLPSVNVGAEGGLAGWDGSTSKTYNINGAASWEIDIFGKITAAKREARASLEKSYAYRQAVQTSLVASVASTYYTLLMLDSQYTVTEETAAKWRQSVETMRAMKEAGMTNEAGVAQYEGNTYAIEASLHDIAYQRTQIENSLCSLLGEAPHAIGRGSLDNQQLPDDLTVGVPLQMLSNRPDIRSAEYTLMQSYYATASARSALYPSITLSGTLGWGNNVPITDAGKLIWNAAGSLLQPIFNANANRARVKIAKAQQEESRLSFQQALLNAGAEVNNALTQCQSARAKTDLRARQIAAMQRAVESTELLMQHGSTTYLEVLTAQQSLLSAQLSQISDRFDEIQGVVNLYQALGGGRDITEEK